MNQNLAYVLLSLKSVRHSLVGRTSFRCICNSSGVVWWADRTAAVDSSWSYGNANAETIAIHTISSSLAARYKYPVPVAGRVTCVFESLVFFRYFVEQEYIKIYKIYSLTKLSVKQLFLKIFHIIFYSYMFRFVSVEPSSGWAF
jgi:hypothetical protein